MRNGTHFLGRYPCRFCVQHRFPIGRSKSVGNALTRGAVKNGQSQLLQGGSAFAGQFGVRDLPTDNKRRLRLAIRDFLALFIKSNTELAAHKSKPEGCTGIMTISAMVTVTAIMPMDFGQPSTKTTSYWCDTDLRSFIIAGLSMAIIVG